MPDPGRDAALTVRLAAERGRRLDVAFAEHVARLEPRERRFAHELAFGVTRLRGRLDRVLAPHVRRGVDELDPAVLEVLRLGAYQILFLDGVPQYAAVSAAVDQVRARVGPKPAGLVNAVLRRVTESGSSSLAALAAEEGVDALVGHGSHPEWLVRRWLDRWSEEDVRALVEHDNGRPGTFLTPLAVDAEEAARRLVAAGLEATAVGEGTESVRLAKGVSASDALAALPDSVVQDPGAHLVVLYSDLPAGTVVADLCAAPGGKALATTRRAGTLIACDRSESRIRMLTENARRAGTEVDCVVADAARPPFKEVDAVLLDAPCTGTGTLARHPDARWRLRPESITELAGVQRRLLRSTASIVRPGGTLVYSTCTLEPEENEDVVADFLAEHPDFALEPTEAVPPRYLGTDGSLRVLPQRTGFDGSYAARLARAG